MPITGSIVLQGIDVSQVPLKKYRDTVHIYPDSFIFSGNLRSFLDPRGHHSDSKLNELLDEFDRATARGKEGQSAESCVLVKLDLEHVITAGGGNLSEGQKCVCALVRAALADAAVVVLDEITSSMDMTSSKKAIEILHRELVRKNTAVLLVSHRPEDLGSCSAVWKMDAGVLTSGL